MKHLKLMLWLLVAIFTLSACTSQDDEGTDDSGNKSSSIFSRYFALEITDCQRVGDNLVADFKVTNKSGKTIKSLQLIEGNRSFDNNSNYYNARIRVNKGSWSGGNGSSKTVSLAKGESVEGSFLIENFKETASWVKIDFGARCSELWDTEEEVFKNRITAGNKYQRTDSIQTNDRGLTYKLLSTKFETTSSSQKTCYLTFRITNNSGTDITDFNLDAGTGGKGQFKDDLGNGYYYAYVAFGDNSLKEGWDATISLADGKSVTATIAIPQVKANASTLTGYATISSSILPMECSKLYFLNVSAKNNSSTGGEEKEEGGDEEESGSSSAFSKNFQLTIKNCERVGDNLVADFKIVNKSGKTVASLDLSNYYSCADQNGTTYYPQFRIKKGSWNSTISTTSLEKGDSLVGSLRIVDFDKGMTADWVKLRFAAECSLWSGKEEITKDKLAVGSKFIHSKGFQTNDKDLTVEYLSTTTRNDYTYVQFRVTNNMKYNITDFTLNASQSTVKDDLGNRYYGICVGTTNNNSYGSLTTNIGSGNSVIYTLRINEVATTAETFNGSIYCASSNIPLECDYIKFNKVSATTYSANKSVDF